MHTWESKSWVALGSQKTPEAALRKAFQVCFWASGMAWQVKAPAAKTCTRFYIIALYYYYIILYYSM